MVPSFPSVLGTNLIDFGFYFLQWQKFDVCFNKKKRLEMIELTFFYCPSKFEIN